MSGCHLGISVLVAGALCLTAPVGALSVTAPCARCGWLAPVTERMVQVSTVGDLYRAVAEAKPGTTLLLADGEYRLSRMLDIATARVVLRGGSGDFSKVVLRGAGISEKEVGVAISVSAPDVTMADLTAGEVGFH